MDKIKRFNARLTQLKKDRQTHEPVWEDILNHIAPDLKGYLNGESNDGSRKDEVVYDGTPVKNNNTCAAGMHASVTSPSRPWFRLRLADPVLAEISDVRIWLDDCAEVIYHIMHDSNFYQSVHTIYLHLAPIGTACMLIVKDYEHVIHCRTLNVGEYWIGVNGKSEVDTLYREFKLTAMQLVDLFGEEKLPKKILNEIKNDSNVEHTVIHVIEPDRFNMAPFGKKYVSVYYLQEAKKDDFLSVGGFDHLPFVAPRWGANQGEAWGKFNPGRISIGNCKQLQTLVYDFHEALQKINNPPLQGNADNLENNQVVGVPGAFNPTSATGTDVSIRPLYQVNPDIQATWQTIEDKKQQIASDFFVDLFQAVSQRIDKEMTATEIREVATERMLVLGPVLENLQNELLNPIIDIIFQYAMDAGIFPEPPEEIQGREIKVDYISTLAQAQQIADKSRIDEVLAFVGNAAQLNPEVLDKVDFDQAVDEVNKMVGTPSGVIRDDETVAKLRQMRQEQLAQQQQQAQMMQMAQSAQPVATAAKTLSETENQGALAAMLQGVGGGTAQ